MSSKVHRHVWIKTSVKRTSTLRLTLGQGIIIIHNGIRTQLQET